MASVHRDPRSPKGVWYCSYTLADGRRVLRSTGKKSKAEAKIICQAWAEAERAAGDASLSTNRAAQIINETLQRCGRAPLTRVKLGEWFGQWLAAKTSLSPAVQGRYRYAFTQFLEFLGAGSPHRFLDSIDTSDIQNFAAHLASEGRCAATINRIIRADLAGAFNRAVKLGKIRFSPIAGLEPERDRISGVERKTFTPGQVARLIETARGTDWTGAILFGYTTGARLGDVANLRWDSIDLEQRVIVFRQRKTAHKTDRETIVGLHPDFENWLLSQPAPDELAAHVFPTLATRSNGGKKGLSNAFNLLVTRSGIDAGVLRQRRGMSGRSRRNLSFHSLRHTAASTVYNNTIARETARRITDHAGSQSLDRYLHVDLAAIKSATALIPRLPLA